MGSKYTIRDLFQGLVGSFDMVIFYIVLRSGETMPFLSKTQGLFITAVWLGILFFSFKQYKGEHFIQNLIANFIMCAILCEMFKISTIADTLANPLGSPAMVFTWLGLPVSLIMDKRNQSNVLKRYYVEG